MKEVSVTYRIEITERACVSDCYSLNKKSFVEKSMEKIVKALSDDGWFVNVKEVRGFWRRKDV